MIKHYRPKFRPVARFLRLKDEDIRNKRWAAILQEASPWNRPGDIWFRRNDILRGICASEGVETIPKCLLNRD